MIKLKDLLSEMVGDWDGNGPAWSGKTYEFISDWMIPISPPVIKKILGDIKVSVFHSTDINGIKKLKGLTGKSKSISSFKGIGDDSTMFLGYGMQNMGGIIIQIEGYLLANSAVDLSTRPDESGRRWIHPLRFETMYGIKINKNDLKKKLYKFSKVWRETKGDFKLTNKLKSQLIRDYMDMIEKDVWKKNASKIRKSFGKNLGKVVSPNEWNHMQNHWNELIVNKIKLKDALLLGNRDDWSEEDYENAEKITKSIVTGTVEWSDGPGSGETENWIKKRTGTVYS